MSHSAQVPSAAFRKLANPDLGAAISVPTCQRREPRLRGASRESAAHRAGLRRGQSSLFHQRTVEGPSPLWGYTVTLRKLTHGGMTGLSHTRSWHQYLGRNSASTGVCVAEDGSKRGPGFASYLSLATV